MESFPLFFRIRAITFTLIILFSFLWLVLLSVEIYARWTMSDQITRSLMVLFCLTNTITLILLPILLLVKFRAWLDAARLFLLFVLQVGSAAAGTYWSPRIQCPDQTPDDIGVCQLISVYTLIACWTIPAILVFYLSYFAIVVYLQSRIPVVVKSERRSGADPEKGPTDSVSSWKEMLKEIVGTECSSIIKVQPRPLVLPAMAHTAQSPVPQPALPNTRRQSTMPSLPHTSKQSDLSAPHSVPSRHRSLPAVTHGGGPHIRAVLTLPIADTSPASSHPQTPSSHSRSTPSAMPLNQSFGLGPSVVDAMSPPRGHQWRSKHLSMMPSSSSPREMKTAQGSPTMRSTRTRLSKPIPAHLL